MNTDNSSSERVSLDGGCFVTDRRGKTQLRRGGDPEIDLEADKVALLIIDAQFKEVYWDRGYFNLCHEAFGNNSSCGPREDWETWGHWNPVLPNIVRLLGFFRQHKLPVVHTYAGCFMEDMRDFQPQLRRYYARVEQVTGQETATRFGTPECEIVDEVRPIRGEIVLPKRSAGVFSTTPIDQILRQIGVEQLVITGGSTTGCAFVSMVGAFDHGYHCFTVLDALFPYSSSAEHRQDTVKLYNGFATVWDTDDVLEELAASPHCAKRHKLLDTASNTD